MVDLDTQVADLRKRYHRVRDAMLSGQDSVHKALFLDPRVLDDYTIAYQHFWDLHWMYLDVKDGKCSQRRCLDSLPKTVQAIEVAEQVLSFAILATDSSL